MMGSAAAFDMARTPQVETVTLADNDLHRAHEVAARINRIAGHKKLRAVALDASGGCHQAAARTRCGPLRRSHVGGLPEKPMPPFHYQLVFSVEGLINEYLEPARILHKGKLVTIEALTEPEEFHMPGFSPLIAFHTSGGTSTMPETFEGRVGECFEKTLRYPGHYDLLCELKELGLFSSDKMKFGKAEIAPRALMSKAFEGKFASKGPDVCIMRLEAHESIRTAGIRGLLGGRLQGHVASFTMVDHYDPKTDMSAMMRTTAFPASIVVQMLASGAISKRGGVLQERDVPADMFLDEMARRGIKIEYAME